MVNAHDVRFSLFAWCVGPWLVGAALVGCGGNVTPDPPAAVGSSIAMGADGARGPTVGVLMSPIAATAATPPVTLDPFDPYPDGALSADSSAAPPSSSTATSPRRPPVLPNPDHEF